MNCETPQLLAKIRHLVEQHEEPPERRLKDVLRLLRRSLQLHNLTLLDRSGPELFALHAVSRKGHIPPIEQPAADSSLPGLHSLAIPLDNACELLLLIPRDSFSDAAATAVASLVPALSQSVRPLLNVIRGESNPAATASTRLIETQLLADLGRAVIAAADGEELLQRIGPIMLRYSGAAAVVLRDLAGEALLGPPRSFFSAGESLPAPLVLEEESRALYALTSGKEAVWRPVPSEARIALTIPLVVPRRQVGTLSLFLPRLLARRRRPDLDHLRELFSEFAILLSTAMERFATQERLIRCCDGNERQLRELSALYRFTRGMQSAPRLNELIHFLLSAACKDDGGGFERAMIFLYNERTAILQGMLGVTRDSALLVLPPEQGSLAWEHPRLDDEVQRAQRQTAFCRAVMKQRLSLRAEDNPLAHSVLTNRVVFVPDVARRDTIPWQKALGLGPFACIPLPGKGQSPGVIVVDNPISLQAIGAERLRFLELFAGQAGAAMANALLIKHLETAHREIQESHQHLVQGEKLALLGEMAATLAHEVKTPLVSIGGFARRLIRLCDDATQRDYAGIIAREATRLEDLLGGILAFSRKQLLCYGPLDTEALIHEALELEGEALATGGIEVHSQIASDLPVVQGDGARLKQVLINLVANARLAMPRGGKLTLRARPALLRGKPAVAIEIEDTGCGIPVADFQNLFRPFFTSREGGTGLGLPISASIVEQHRGELTAANVPAGGALFRILLPA